MNVEDVELTQLGTFTGELGKTTVDEIPDVSFCVDPHVTNGLSHRYQMGESTFIFRVIRSDFFIFR